MTCGLWVVWSCSLSVYHSVGPNCTNKVSSSETLGDFNSIIFFCSRGVLLKTKMMTSLLLQPLASIVRPFLAFLTVSTISFFISICQDLQGWNWTLLSAWFQMELAITCAATCIRQEICWPWTKTASQVIAQYLNRPPKNQHDPVYTPETMKMFHHFISNHFAKHTSGKDQFDDQRSRKKLWLIMWATKISDMVRKLIVYLQGFSGG